MSAEGPDNTAEIAKARRRYKRYETWFYGWLIVMCVTPCALFSELRNVGQQSDLSFGIMMFGIIAPLVALGGMLLMVNDTSRSKRRWWLAIKYDRLGFEYIDQPEMAKLAFLHGFQSLNAAPVQKATSMGRGRYADEEVLAMDFLCRWPGEEARNVHQTILVLTGAAKDVPGMLVQPMGFWGTSGTIKVKGEEAFNRAYSLASKWFEEAPRFISRRLAALCLDERCIGFEVRNGDLMVFWRGELLEPSNLVGPLKAAAEIARLLRDRRDELEGR